MSYKNSAGVKLNDKTELVITADPDGTVNSVFNKADGTEYITSMETATVSFKNTTNSAKNVYYATTENGYLTGFQFSLSANGTQTKQVIKNTMVMTNSANTWSIVSGDAEIITQNRVLVKDVCSLEIV